MNLEDLRWRVRELAGISETDMDTSPADLDGFINSAYRMVLGLHDWPFLRERVEVEVLAGTRAVALPAPAGGTARAVRSVRGGDMWLRPREWTRLPADGELASYATVGADMLSVPVQPVDVTLEVERVVDPPALAAAADLPVFPSVYHETLALIAAAKVLRRRRDSGDVGRASDLDSDAAVEVRRMRTDLLVDHDTTPAIHGGRQVIEGRSRL